MTEEKYPIPLKSDAPVAAGLWRVCGCARFAPETARSTVATKES